MITNRTVAGVAMLFAAVMLAHPGPAMAQADVDAAMGVLPSPGETQGIIIVNNKPGGDGNEAGMEIGDDEPDELPGVGPRDGNKPGGDGATRGIVIVNSRPGDDAASKGFNPQPEPPALKILPPGTLPAPDAVGQKISPSTLKAAQQ